ncbi:isopenicillin N synthase family oxygenase [Parvularcula sp. IMCC14364]|uniref:isopenicillin N synthase family dioxygenase n=1 Tax=Parvularcula sp. IMCC14364 TaxID=3067902 RepID=UPI0027411659|nr:2-oxoglutarate and iron-dependent oxygenase domain-containing protein [Parvularcula sp. IMCC14364]
MTRYTTVPELSLASYTHGDAAARAAFADALYEGFRYFGFIILRDHGISEDLLNRAYRASENFFALPEAEKMKCDSGVGGQRGYTAFGREHAKGSSASDLKEFWHVGREFSAGDALADIYPPNMWPTQPTDFRQAFLALYDALEETGHVMLEALAPSLGLDADYFRKLAVNGNSILRLLHYPPVPDGAEPGAMRAAAHEDINLITLLVAASSAGLELLDRDGNWLPVEGSRNAIIVDAGDMLARITNNHIPATTHRVVNPEGPNISRYSMPFFMHPRADAVLSCIENCRDGTEAPDIVADDFLQQRLREIGLTG